MTGRAASRAAVTIALLLIVAGQCAAEESVTPPAAHTPAPYMEEEFPRWLRDLRRAEVILIGSIPFTMFFTFETYDTYRYVASGLDPYYAPWPFRPGSAQQYTTQEKVGIVLSGLSLSLLIAAADYLIGRIHERSPRR